MKKKVATKKVRLSEAYFLNFLDSQVKWEVAIGRIRRKYSINLLQVEDATVLEAVEKVSPKAALIGICIAPHHTGQVEGAIKAIRRLALICPKAECLVLISCKPENLTREERSGLEMLPKSIRYMPVCEFARRNPHRKRSKITV